MEFYQVVAVGAIFLITYLSIVFYLKRRWGLEGNPPQNYSKTHKSIRFGVSGVAIALILVVGLTQFNAERPFPIMTFPIIGFFFIELVNIYMQKKHGENPKWTVISWVTVAFVILMFIGAVYLWASTPAY
ncbi:DUF4181 domain-containing protein [Chryseomicrobium sp. FSL W7-1435]|uniref:DUF4181 domain-containing protein n=1 Tax=Chryseomicrobium sp. FSL W7-1435 TaxID=2921704 RepID=UPI003159AE5E